MQSKEMEVVLAGYSLDHELVEAAREGRLDEGAILTPETLSAAYARISRDPAPVTELRARARKNVMSARKSNRIIVFGLGHHSVAEHVQLNFDILNLSRLVVEALQEARLCSYTEKSQRYITFDGDYTVPEEFDASERQIQVDLNSRQVALYQAALPRLLEYQRSLHPEMGETARDIDTVEGWAKEDARYALSLATQAQLGFSSNARNLEHVIRKLRYHPLAEARGLGRRLYDSACQVVPSLVILADRDRFKKTFAREVSDDFLELGPGDVAEASRVVLESTSAPSNEEPISSCGDVALLSHTPDPDLEIAASLLFSSTGLSQNECIGRARELRSSAPESFERFVLESMKRLTAFDPPTRAFETAYFNFEMTLSSSAFAQLKRHRLMTLIKQPYDPALGCTYPESVDKVGLRDQFESVFEESSSAYRRVEGSVGGEAAAYLLTNAHRRRVLVSCNMRELYHMARLRMDAHAQWDIRYLTRDLIQLVKAVAPVSAAMATGKDSFVAVRDTLIS